MADAIVGEQPQHAIVIVAWRDAADEIGIRIGDDARQDRDTKARADTRQQTARRCVVHGHLLLKSQRLQPGLVMDPQIAAATADERMLLQLGAVLGNAVPLGVGAAAVQCPIVDAQLPADEARGLVCALGTP